MSYMNTTAASLPKDHPFRAALPPTARSEAGIIDCGKARRLHNRRAFVLDGRLATPSSSDDELAEPVSSAASIHSFDSTSSTSSNSSLKLVQKLGEEYAAALLNETEVPDLIHARRPRNTLRKMLSSKKLRC